MTLSEIIRLLKTPLKFSKITWTIPGICSFEFVPDDILTLEKSTAVIEDVLRRLFVEREVMWLDLRKEDPDRSQKSLDGIAGELEAIIGTNQDRLPKVHRPIPSLLGQWSTGCVLSAKAIRRKMDEMKQNNRTAFHQDEFVDRSWFMPEVLSEFRKRTYPVIDALIQALPGGSQVRRLAEEKWQQGRNQLAEHEGRDKLVVDWNFEVSQEVQQPSAEPVAAADRGRS